MTSAFHPYDAQRTLDNVFGKMFPTDGDVVVAQLVQCLYKVKPECFVCSGSLHNSEDGTRTYQSVKLFVSNTWNYNIHVYGSLRGSMFRVDDVEFFGAKKTYRWAYPVPSYRDAIKPVNIW